MACVNRTLIRVLIAFLGAGVSELMPIPGMALAIFLGGIHGPYPEAYLITALVLDFAFVFAALYWIVGGVQERILN
jgi:multisubunit Na+/H+ antiporter MnhC subunit